MFLLTELPGAISTRAAKYHILEVLESKTTKTSDAIISKSFILKCFVLNCHAPQKLL